MYPRFALRNGITLKDDSLYVLVHKHNTRGTESSGIVSIPQLGVFKHPKI